MILTSLVAASVFVAGPSASGKVEVSSKDKGKSKGEVSAEVQEERKKPWIMRWGPENNELDLGLYFGAFILAPTHGLFDRGLGQRPQVRRSAFDFGGRATYFPIKYLGIGFGAGVMPTRSPDLDVGARVFTVRGHAVVQGPWRITPTFTIGGGGLGITSSNPRLRSIDGAFHWGPGVKFYIFKWLLARIDGRHIVTPAATTGDRAHHGEILFGVEVPLRFKRIVDRPQKYDWDLDGIENEDDECPEEAGVRPHGCPEDLDTDKDGIPNDRDKCPNKWGDTPSGCPIPDTDGDGIFDSKDSCVEEPETYNGFDDTDGCPDEPPDEVKQFTGVIKGIKFATGKATVRRQSFKLLNKAVRVMNKFPQIRIEIVGHTDSTGSRSNNMELSRARADSVKKYLVDSGIDASRVETRGAGPDEPIADNKSKSGRAENRRIEFKLLRPGATKPKK